MTEFFAAARSTDVHLTGKVVHYAHNSCRVAIALVSWIWSIVLSSRID